MEHWKNNKNSVKKPSRLWLYFQFSGKPDSFEKRQVKKQTNSKLDFEIQSHTV